MSDDVLSALRRLPSMRGDAYGVGRLLSCSVMEAGRSLLILESSGLVVCDEPAGTLNDLARVFRVEQCAACLVLE